MQTLHTDRVITRRNWRPDTYYVDAETDETFVTPDGVGAYFYDSLAEAQKDYDASRIVMMYSKPDLELNPEE